MSNDELLAVKKNVRNKQVDYISGEHQRKHMIEWGKEEGIELIISANLEKNKYSMPFYSVRKKEEIE
jgi:hypothetical protein